MATWLNVTHRYNGTVDTLYHIISEKLIKETYKMQKKGTKKNLCKRGVKQRLSILILNIDVGRSLVRCWGTFIFLSLKANKNQAFIFSLERDKGAFEWTIIAEYVWTVENNVQSPGKTFFFPEDGWHTAQAVTQSSSWNHSRGAEAVKAMAGIPLWYCIKVL